MDNPELSECVMDRKFCTGCKECSHCELKEEKMCDNCMECVECLEKNKDFEDIKIEDIKYG